MKVEGLQRASNVCRRFNLLSPPPLGCMVLWPVVWVLLFTLGLWTAFRGSLKAFLIEDPLIPATFTATACHIIPLQIGLLKAHTWKFQNFDQGTSGPCFRAQGLAKKLGSEFHCSSTYMSLGCVPLNTKAYTVKPDTPDLKVLRPYAFVEATCGISFV